MVKKILQKKPAGFGYFIKQNQEYPVVKQIPYNSQACPFSGSLFHCLPGAPCGPNTRRDLYQSGSQRILYYGLTRFPIGVRG